MSIEVTTYGTVAVVTIDRPPANAYDRVLLTKLAEAVQCLSQNPAVRSVVVRSANPKFFCAGADLRDLAASTHDERMDFVAVSNAVFHAIERAPQPYIAEIAGHALGGGLELALACDLRIAANGPYNIGLPEVAAALMPGGGATQRLPRLIGIGSALDLLLTGRTIRPAEAAAMRIVSYVVDEENIRAEALELATKLSLFSPVAVGSIKRAVREGVQHDLETGLTIERDLLDKVLRTDAAQDALARFAASGGATTLGPS
jgi:enoyl-CoA hydratase/carnithine racemase